MTAPASGREAAALPFPDEGILMTLFITVRKVARSRDFYSRVLGGTVVMEENPCIVRLANSCGTASTPPSARKTSPAEPAGGPTVMITEPCQRYLLSRFRNHEAGR